VFVNSNEKGALAEMSIAREAVRLGIGVLKPLSERQRYDLGLEVGDRILRVQCKWGSLVDDDVIHVRLSTSRYDGRRYIRTSYEVGEIDAVAVYCEPLDSVYLLPIELVAGRTFVHLRLAPAKNGQRASINSAGRFRLSGAIAQLGERAPGRREGGGSSPPGSIVDVPAVAETVGAHIFRQHFGWYMERAAAGTEIRVTKRGRPYVRLVPFHQKLDEAP
jgi:prevent-host-death family protein